MKGDIKGWTDIDDGRIKDTHRDDSGDSDTKAVIIRCPGYSIRGIEYITIEYSPNNDLGNYLKAIGIDNPVSCNLTGGYKLVKSGAATYEWQPITNRIVFFY